MGPKQLSAILMIAAGVLFFLAGVIRRFQQPFWLVLGVVLVVLGTAVLRKRPE